MLVDIIHPNLGPQTTRLSVASAAAATSSTVENNTGFATNDYIVLGVLGEEKSELIILTSTTTSVTIGHSGGLTFDHAVRTPIAEIPYNQAEVYRATSQTGTYSLIATVDLTVDEPYTTYSDATGTSTSWYKIRYKNSNATTYSEYSDVVAGTGYTDDSLRSMADEVLGDFGDEYSKEINRKTVLLYLKAAVRNLTKELFKVAPDYLRAYTTQALTASTATYDLPSRFMGFIRVDVNFTGSTATDAYKVERFESEARGDPNTTYYKSDPRICFRGDQFVIRPTPDSSSGYAFLWYWKYPAVMADEADEHGLPFGARDSLVSYALWRAWLGRDTDKANEYKSMYSTARDSWIDFVSTARQAYNNKQVDVVFGNDLYSD